MKKVSIYTPTYNCAKYVEQAVDSVLKQTYQDFELIVVDDASTDSTWQILQKYKGNPKIKIIKNKKNIGFVRTAIKTINLSKGKYIMRLDADDYLDKNALMIMADVLDKHPEIGMVYPDYWEINEDGEIIDYFRKKKLGEEAELMDLPANGACTLMRKSCYKAIGGYRSDIRMQDKYDIWIKFTAKFKAHNVNLPLFYYRRHEDNISNNVKKILQTRRYIKEKFVQECGKKLPKVLGIIPTRSKFYVYPDFPTRKLAGKPVIYYPIMAMNKASVINKAIFTTEDKDLAKKAKKYGMKTLLRPKEFADPGVGIELTVNHVLRHLEEKEGYFPDVVAILFITSPLVNQNHIKEAINTLLIYDADSVVAVKEDKGYHHKHGKHGLEPLFEKRLLRHEKDLLFEETGSLIVTRREFITDNNLFGKKISHITLTDDEAVYIDNKFKFWLAEQIIKNKKNINKLN